MKSLLREGRGWLRGILGAGFIIGLAIGNHAWAANVPPILHSLSNQTINIGQRLSVAATAFDLDAPPQMLQFDLLSGPTNARVRTVRGTNGIIGWTPGPEHGGTTNLFVVAVGDNGSPSLSATQSFQVIVTRFSDAALGTVVVEAGADTCVPLALEYSAPVTSVRFIARWKEGTLTNITVQPSLPGICTIDTDLSSATQLVVNLDSCPGQSLTLTQSVEVASLCFTAIEGQPSAFVPLTIESAVRAAGGEWSVNQSALTGRVIVVGGECLLEASFTPERERQLFLYARTGRVYQIESSSTLNTLSWQPACKVPMTSLALPVCCVDFTSVTTFYRAYEFGVGPTNLPPLVNAGPDRTLYYSTSLLLGNATDDGLPAGCQPLTFAWTNVAGPGVVTFSNPTSAVTTVTFSQLGHHVLRLSVSDSQDQGSDEVSLSLVPGRPANVPPEVWILSPTNGAIVPLPAVALQGYVSDPDIFPEVPLIISWRLMGGPGAVRFEEGSDPATALASFSAPGAYQLRLTASDSLAATHADVSIHVTSPNLAPMVNAGPPQEINFGERVYLPGTVTDDGQPAPTVVTWTKLSGPGTVEFDFPNRAPTMANFSAAGVYMLRLSAFDGEFTSPPSNVVVRVRPAGSRIYQNIDLRSAGVGGMRRSGAGSIELTAVTGVVQRAWLYWHGPVSSGALEANAGVLVNGRLVFGENIGAAGDNGWGHYASHAYRADVTDLVARWGNGIYHLRHFSRGEVVKVNGASLIVLFDDGHSTNDQDVTIADGNDSNFPREFAANGPVNSLVIQPDGRILIAGLFGGGNTGLNSIARLLPNGKRDFSFNPVAGAFNEIFAMVLQPDGKILIGGAFRDYDRIPRNYVARVAADGKLDPGFVPPALNGAVRALALQPDGKVLVGGEFTDAFYPGRIARLHADGSLDTKFDPGAGADGRINTLALLPDGKILIGGSFTQYDAQPCRGVARLHASGALDSSFAPPDRSLDVQTLLVQDDGFILVGDDLTTFNNEPSALFRLRPNGDRDTNFTPIVNGKVKAIVPCVINGDDRIYIGGSFTNVNGVERRSVAQLTRAGALLADFNPGTGPDSSGDLGGKVLAVANWDGQRPLVAGHFLSFGGLPAASLVLLNTNGSVAPNFTTTDFGWATTLPEANYAGGSVQLHVSDGQHGVFTDYRFLPYYDSPLFVNGILWLEPVVVPICGLDGTSNYQLFEGSSVPSVDPECFRDFVTGAHGNLRCWDIIEAPLPAALPPGRNPLTITDHVYSIEDYLSLVVAVARLPAGSATITNPPVIPPADAWPVARPDRVTVHRRLWPKMLDVLGNDTGAPGHLLSIRSVSLPALGTAEVQHDGSGILYAPDAAQTVTQDQFSYTVADLNGNESTAVVTVDLVDAPGCTPVACGDAAEGVLTAGDALSLTGHPGARADYFTFPGTKGDVLKVYAEQPGTELEYLVYIRNPRGELVAHFAYYSGRELTYRLDSTGPHFMEVTSYDPTAFGAYRFTVSCLPSAHLLELLADNQTLPDKGTLDFGMVVARSLVLRNNADAPLLPDTTMSVSGPFRLMTTRLGSIAARGTPDFMVALTDFSPGRKEGTLVVTNRELPWGQTVTLRAFVPDGPFPPRANARPQAADDSVIAMSDGPVVFINVLTNDVDADGDALTVVEVTPGFAGQTQLASGGRAISYRPQPGLYGFDQFSYTVSDGRGGRSSARVSVKIVNHRVEIITPEDDPQPPFSTNVPVPILAAATTSDGAVLNVEFFVNDAKAGQAARAPYAFSFTPTNSGFYTIKAVASFEDGTRLESAGVRIGVNTGPDDRAPVAAISSLVEGQVLREGRIELLGTADDPDLADQPSVEHRVELFRVDSDGLTPLGALVPEGAPPGVFRPGRVAEGGSLGTLDFTLRENGVHVLALLVRAGGAESRSEVRFILDSQVKIGQLTFSEQDVIIPVHGFPLTVVRTYDSLNAASGAFGAGWTYTIYDLRVQFDEERELTADDEGEFFSLRTGGGRNVTLTLPDGRRTTFVYSLKPGPSDGGVPCFCYVASWTPPPNVQATLDPVENNVLQFIPFQSVLQPYWAAAGPETPMENFDFSEFILTDADGTRYVIGREDGGTHFLESEGALLPYVHAWGKARLKTIVRRTGDRLEIGRPAPAGGASSFKVQYYSAQSTAPSRALLFQRDEQGRITEIHAPNSLDAAGVPLPGELPLMKYVYAGGNLAEVHKLIDKNRPYSVREYRYENAAYPHYLTSIRDPLEPYQNLLENFFDAGGRFTGARTLANDDFADTQIEHDLENGREIITNPLGERTVHEYDRRGNVVRSIDALGRVTTRAYDDHGWLLSETDPLGRATTYAYDARGYRTRIVDPLGRVTTAAYDAFGNVLSMTDARRNAAAGATPSVVNTYDSRTGNLVSSTDAAGRSTTYAYDAAGRLLSVTDALGHLTLYEYYGTNEPGGNEGDLKRVAVRQKSVNAQQQPVFQTLSATTYTYDANGNRLTQTLTRTLPDGSTQAVTTAWLYDGQNRVVETRDALYDPLFPQLHATRTIYDPQNRVAATIDTAGRETTYLYDGRGNLIQTTYPADGVTPATFSRTVYDGLGRAVATQDAGAATGTLTVYDAAGRVARTEVITNMSISVGTGGVGSWYSYVDGVPAVGRATATTYDAAGQVIATTDARGHVTRFEHDAAGRRTAVIDALGQVSRFAYDENGNQTAFTNALGRVTRQHYDALNRRIGVEQPLLPGQATALAQWTGYDELGRRVAHTNEDGTVTRFGYDALGRLVAVTNDWRAGASSPFVTTYAYDETGALVRQTDANGHATTFEYDALGRRVARTLPGGQRETMTYDAAGNLDLHTDFNGRRMQYAYDARHRLLRKIDLAAPEDSFPFYEATYNARGQRLTLGDPSCRIVPEDEGVPEHRVPTTFAYDAFNRLAGKVVSNGSNPARYELSYEYDLAGNVTSISTLGSTQLRYEWDALNRLTNVVDSANPNAPKMTAYRYDAVGNLQSVTAPNTVQHRYRYDGLNRLTNLVIAAAALTLAQFDYAVANTGQRTQLVEQVNSATRVYAWHYDRLHRLTNEAISNLGTLSYRYDPVGNRLARTSTLSPLPSTLSFPPSQSLTYGSNDWLTAHTYDANGNTLLGDTDPPATTPDVYDLENRLIRRTVGSRVIDLAYDGDGHRVRKTITDNAVQPPAVTHTFYLVDDRNPTGYAQVLEEHTAAESWMPVTLNRSYSYGLDLISHSTLSPLPSTFFYAVDGLGSTRLLADTNGAVLNTFCYDAYGVLLVSDAPPQTSYLHAGEQWDRELGSYYLRAPRYYDPNLGRFTTMDSFEGHQTDPLSLHKYLYCHANPANLVDPSGHHATSSTEVGFASSTAVTLNQAGISFAASAFVNYMIYSGAKGVYDDYRIRQLAQNLGVEIEPSVYLHEVQNGLDASRDQRKREPGWAYFAHGTSTGAWGNSSTIMANGGGDFGTGFYTFKANLRGLFWAGGQATRTATRRGGLPFILVAKIKQEDLGGMMTSAQDLRGDTAQWTTTVTGYLNNGGLGSSGHPIVIGPVSAQGRRLNPGETPTQRADIPDQWKWEDVSNLKPAAIIPVFNGFSRQIAW